MMFREGKLKKTFSDTTQVLRIIYSSSLGPGQSRYRSIKSINALQLAKVTFESTPQIIGNRCIKRAFRCWLLQATFGNDVYFKDFNLSYLSLCQFWWNFNLCQKGIQHSANLQLGILIKKKSERFFKTYFGVYPTGPFPSFPSAVFFATFYLNVLYNAEDLWVLFCIFRHRTILLFYLWRITVALHNRRPWQLTC